MSNVISLFISVVIPVRNEANFIKSTIFQILRQDYPKDKLEVIVVDGNSTDGTKDIVHSIELEHSIVRLLDNPKLISSAGRNIGFRYGVGDVFVIIDGHCFIPDTCLLKNIAEAFMKSGADCLGRPQPLDPPGLTKFQKAVAMARNSHVGHGGGSLIYSEFEGFASPVSNGAAYRKEVFQRIGYVDERFDACEDVEFNVRVEKAGLRTWTSPALTVRYFPRETLFGLLRQMIRYGRGRFKLLAKHPSTFSYHLLVPPIFALGVVIFQLLCLYMVLPVPAVYVLGEMHGFLAFLLSLYALLILGESVRVCWMAGFQFLRWLPAIFLSIHFGLGWGFLTECGAWIKNRCTRDKVVTSNGVHA